MWVAARLLPRREVLALRCLALGGFATYLPRMREPRIMRGRTVDATPALFPGYCFIAIEMQWHSARWTPGVASLIMDGQAPARVPDKVIAEIQAREVRGLIELAPPPPPLKPGDAVRITRGPLQTIEGLYAGQAPHERVLVLLQVLGAARQVTLPAADVEPLPVRGNQR